VRYNIERKKEKNKDRGLGSQVNCLGKSKTGVHEK
jgi:hypothetical protein